MSGVGWIFWCSLVLGERALTDDLFHNGHRVHFPNIGDQVQDGSPNYTIHKTAPTNASVDTKFRGISTAQMMTTDEFIEQSMKQLAKYHERLLDQTLIQKIQTEFPCPITKPSPKVPLSVHQLRPGDIKVIANMGDSISAGTGIEAKHWEGDVYEWRGLTFTAGGQRSFEQVITLPNILKKYNPELYGYSTGVELFWQKSERHLNVAVAWSTAREMPGQAQELIRRMKSNKNVDFKNDWKIINIFVGHNDLCSFYCFYRKKYGPKAYISQMQEALDMLYLNVPRAFVNVLEPGNVTDFLYGSHKFEGLICPAFHSVACHCAYTMNTEQWVTAYGGYIRQINELVDSGRYENKDDFTVVVQPFMRHSVPMYLKDSNIIDPKFLAADCFHWSLITHQEAAKGLWSNMVEPVGRKKKFWTYENKMECPTEEMPYLYTKINSRQYLDVHDETTIRPKRTPQTTLGISKRSSYIISFCIGFIVFAAVVGFVAKRFLKKLSRPLRSPFTLEYQTTNRGP